MFRPENRSSSPVPGAFRRWCSTATEATTEPFFLGWLASRGSGFASRRTFGARGRCRHAASLLAAPVPRDARTGSLGIFRANEETAADGPSPGPGSASPDVPRSAPSRSRFLSTLRGQRVGSPVTDARENAEGAEAATMSATTTARASCTAATVARAAPRSSAAREDRDDRAPPRVTPPHGGGGVPHSRVPRASRSARGDSPPPPRRARTSTPTTTSWTSRTRRRLPRLHGPRVGGDDADDLGVSITPISARSRSAGACDSSVPVAARARRTRAGRGRDGRRRRRRRLPSGRGEHVDRRRDGDA